MKWNLGLNFYSSEVVLFNPKDLDLDETKNFIKDNKYHIYVVCKRKKLFFESSEVDGVFCKTTLYYLNDKHEKEYLRYKHPNTLVINGFQDGYYDVNLNGQKNLKIRDFLMISNFCYLEQDIVGNSITDPLPSDLEVLYIGQAFGRTARKTIDYRISNHDKVQKIALDILDKGSNEEVLIIGLKIKNNDIGTSIVTIDSNTKAPTIQDLQDLVTKASKRITEGQEITVFEASLIKYFQPDLNTEYKETFPSPDFTSYEEIFETDFNYSAMTIDTKPIFTRIFSKHITERKYIHSQHFPLTSKSDKETLFEYLYELSEKK
jgi:hypothetical protein